MRLTTIDFEAPVADQAHAMAAACESTGFFQLPLSVVPRPIADAAWDAAAEFFALDDEVKRSIEFPEPGYPYGFAPFGYEALAKSVDSRSHTGPDLKESLSVGPDCGRNAPASALTVGEEWIRSASLWPEHPSGMRDAWTGYYQALADVAAQLMSVMALALDLPPTYFDSLIDRPISSMRALHYPAIDSGWTPEGSLRAGAHTDYGTLTILRTDEVAGLEIQTRDGNWEPAVADPESFVVNLGDSIAQWTNDRWRSTMHRVALSDTAARQSFAFFHMANWDATIECLPTCLPDGAKPNHDPVQAGPWLMQKFHSTVG